MIQLTPTEEIFPMKKISCIVLLCAFYGAAAAQSMVMKMQMKAPIPNICGKDVYVMMFDGQEEPVPPLSKRDIEKKLETNILFLKDKPTFKDRGTVNIVVNCKGDVVQCQIDTKTKSEVLDQQIVAVFQSLGRWNPGKLDGKKVDASKPWSFVVNNGKITMK